ncbi:sensor histidine kinase [Vibrio splendidus]|uniref:sensor histidine kinase n=1 Tax=Vibrio splendidus TaxID=29497 RepID=UPI000C8656C3|nr:ATP-binding protein [Vibrio splendidus]PMI76129.1 ATP-binding protein [Vibrio splendidus]PMK60974.1 ATP-binding protein [Vibrio splendidus]
MSSTLYALFDNKEKLITTTLEESAIKSLLTQSNMSGSVVLEGEVESSKFLIVSNSKGKCLAVTKDKDYSKSRRVFEKHLLMLIETIEPIKTLSEHANQELRVSTHRLIHNLTSINAHNIQEIYGQFPQDLISSSGKKNINLISDMLMQKPKHVAKTILRLAKNNAAMKAEFAVFKRLYDKNLEVNMNFHKVHRVLMNILYTFFPDFTHKQVNVIVHDSDELAYMDYDTFHVAMFHILDNAAKYTKNDSQFDIYITRDGDYINIAFEMDSILIEDDELDHIFQEGYSGKSAHLLFKSGQGIGMARVREMLDLNQGKINIVKTGPIKAISILGLEISYQRNIFNLSFLARKPGCCKG